MAPFVSLLGVWRKQEASSMVVVCQEAGWPVVSSCMDSFAARTSLDNAAVADALGMLVSVWGWQPLQQKVLWGGCRAAAVVFDGTRPFLL